MSDEFKNLCDEAVRANREPTRLTASALRRAGARKARRRTLGTIGSSCVAAVAATALVFGLQAPSGNAVDDSATSGPTQETSGPLPEPSGEPSTNEIGKVFAHPNLSAALRDLFAAHAPDVPLRADEMWGEEPLDLHAEEQTSLTGDGTLRLLVGHGRLGEDKGEATEGVTVRLHLPGPWTDEPHTGPESYDAYMDGEYLYTCEDGEYAGGGEWVRECREDTGPDGETVVTVTENLVDGGRLLLNCRYTLVFREDTAIQLSTCSSVEDNMTEEPSSSLLLDFPAMRAIALGIPEIPREL